ncbi:MAG: ABC transporter permease subunit/CPBP intramembrane protease [Planctomycetaceae bacterium]
MSHEDAPPDIPHHESQKPRWSNVWLIYAREMRDQLRDRRTLFTLIVLPILLYPLVGTLLLQIAQFSREYPTVVCVVGNEHLDGLPPLLTADGFADGLSDSKQRLELVQYRWDEFSDRNDIRSSSENWVRDGIYDVVLVFPPEMANAIANRESAAATAAKPQMVPTNAEVDVVFNVALDQSLVGRDRIADILNRWRDTWVSLMFQDRQIDASLLRPFVVTPHDIAPTSVREAAFWSKMLPFVMLVWAMTGAFYPAIDLVAGEKERGTLETLLCSPALRGEIVWGKLAAVTTFSMLTAVLNVGSMLVTSALVFRQMSAGAVGAFAAPPLVPLLWLVVALVPLSALFSAVALAVAAMARSSKEGQYYLMPLMMVSLPLVLLPLMPGTTLTTGTSLIPVTGMFLLVRALVEGQYASVLMHLPMVFGVTAGALCIATRWARRQFEAESVLFAGGEQWEFSRWARRMWQDRQLVATPTQAYFAAAIVLIALFFGKLAVTSMPHNFAGIVKLVIVPQLGLILAPTLLMAIICTRSLRQSLRLNVPSSPWTIPLALLLGVSLHPLYVLLATWISTAYPISESAMATMKPFADQISAAPWLYVVLLMAVLPAICEELAYRGFMFGGLARDGSPLRAIMITSVVFGVSHGVLQQSISATCMGLVLGWVALRTGSVLPGMMIHVANNALSVSLGRIAELDHSAVRFFIQSADGGVAYQPIWTVIAGCIALCCLLCFTFQSSSRAASDSQESGQAVCNFFCRLGRT